MTIQSPQRICFASRLFSEIKDVIQDSEPSSLWLFHPKNLIHWRSLIIFNPNESRWIVRKTEEQYYGQAINLKQQDANEFSNRIKNSLPELIDSF